MDMNDSTFSPASVLSEQVARQIFEIIPETGPVVAILDKDGNCWPSDSEKFSKLHLSEHLLKEICRKVDDGEEPVVTQHKECSIVSAQLATKKTNCGYVIIALPCNSPESTLTSVDLIEIFLNQVNLVATLIEKNNFLYELQLRQHVAGHLESSYN